MTSLWSFVWVKIKQQNEYHVFCNLFDSWIVDEHHEMYLILFQHI